jgi:5-methyltetrahydropteroyltriglutamate--homocysteine methyltransferase
MPTTTPPFRADMVGSLLRTAPLKDARAKREKGAITPAQLKSVEDEEIRKILEKQAEVGLQLATTAVPPFWWHFDFSGTSRAASAWCRPRHSVPASRPAGEPEGYGYWISRPHPCSAFQIRGRHTKLAPKMTIPRRR